MTQHSDETLTVLVYSDDRNTRAQVTEALGDRPAADLPEITFQECATTPAVLRALEKGGVDLCVFDGEAVPAGGLGLARQVKDEIYGCPPVLVLIGRPQDSWLAAWSRADAAISQPVDPVALAGAAVTLLRSRVAGRALAR
ncbi:hypothetical protein C7C46_25580 [Streptomyces tateyamensis]|uniref:Response regulatory domain-containing protein n=1 Tax=Streptomyces tateyamensis TaxID=565073 RepID=A0A2V4N7U1_9ACTN|nr:hypothetical protein [Streptomyces tateyamensis]PYC72962.1 hypothetical protein C7C46_25580 [Streptomyces tateyamensis]